jgi:hypothetical protein
MAEQRGCAWISGPRDTTVQMSAAKWWLAISRNMFIKSQRGHASRMRPPVSCHLTPTFSRPLAEDRHS